jgi:hypothetical protein
MGAQPDPRILGLAAQPDPRSGGLAGQPNPTFFYSFLGVAQHYWVLLGSRTQHWWLFLEVVWVWLSRLSCNC